MATSPVAVNGNNDEDTTVPPPVTPQGISTAYSPRNDFIDMLANKVVKIINTNAEKPIQNALDDHLPSDKESVRNLPFYNTTIDSIKYQRDNYLVGTNYATRKEKERQLEKEQSSSTTNRTTRRFTPPTVASVVTARLGVGGIRGGLSSSQVRMPRDATALGYIQIVNLSSWFIPSSTIKESLLPIVVSLPSGPLKETITNTVCNAIPLAQPSLDRAVKNAVLDFIDSPQMRQMVKNRTEKILKVNDSNDKGNNETTTTTTTQQEIMNKEYDWNEKIKL